MIDQRHRPAVLFTDHGKPACVGAACIPDDDHCITFSGKPDCFFLSHFRSSAYRLQRFRDLYRFFLRFRGRNPNFFASRSSDRPSSAADRAACRQNRAIFAVPLRFAGQPARCRSFAMARTSGCSGVPMMRQRRPSRSALFDPVDFFHKRTRCIDDFKAPCGQFLLHRLFHAVRPQDDRLAGLRLVRRRDLADAEPCEALDHVAVVDDRRERDGAFTVTDAALRGRPPGQPRSRSPLSLPDQCPCPSPPNLYIVSSIASGPSRVAGCVVALRNVPILYGAPDRHSTGQNGVRFASHTPARPARRSRAPCGQLRSSRGRVYRRCTASPFRRTRAACLPRGAPPCSFYRFPSG